MAGATGPKGQTRKRPASARAVVGPLTPPTIKHPGVTKVPLSDIPLPEGVSAGSVDIVEGPTVKTVTKGIPKSLKE